MACCSGGEFRVTVRHAGYATAIVDNDIVEEGSCSRPKTLDQVVPLVVGGP